MMVVGQQVKEISEESNPRPVWFEHPVSVTKVVGSIFLPGNLSNSSLNLYQAIIIDHFTVVCLVAWPLNESETGVDLVLIETSLLFLC